MSDAMLQPVAPADSRLAGSSSGRSRRVIVTIDGPAGTGKSSNARKAAAALELSFLDTGAMYRGVAALAFDHGLMAPGGPLPNERALAELLREADLRFDWSCDPPELLAFGGSIAARLRDKDVNDAVSPISTLRSVRQVLVERQRRIGETHQRLVSEGRDQGSVVFFDADVKIYLTASSRVRAERRARQTGRTDIDAIEAEIVQRDERDSTRAVGPLVCPEGAVVLDSSHLSEAETVEQIVRIVRERVPDAFI
ncbi:MAG: (d)CMP kinase [Phycisphaerales bacterium]|nr:(d)CMP kinase [Phycisphaerales bacterium]